MIVFHVITGLGRGGAEAMLYKLLCYQESSDLRHVVVSMTTGGYYASKIKALDVPVYEFDIRKKINCMSSVFKYKKLLNRYKPDIVQAWMYHANVFVALFKCFSPRSIILFNIRKSLDAISMWKKTTRYVLTLNRMLSSKASKVINNSKHSIIQHQQSGFCKYNCLHIPNGFDLELFQPSSERYCNFRKAHSMAENTRIIGNISRYHPQKNHSGFLFVAKKILEKYSFNNICFVLAGPGCDSLNELLIKEIDKLSLSDKVLLLGPVSSDEIMPAFDVYLSTSLTEGFPNVIGEAMCCGVSCVATNVGDCADIIGGYGCVADTNDHDELANHCITALNDDFEKKQSIRRHIADNYPIDKVVKQYSALYYSFLNT